MKVRYDVGGLDGGLNMRFENKNEALDLTRKLAKESACHLATITKIVWNNNGSIVEHRTCFVKADGTWYF